MKNRALRHIVPAVVLAASACLATACFDVEDDRPECGYRVQLRYHYNRENTTMDNVIDRYVAAIDEYIFDGNDILYAVNRVAPDPCGGGMKSELDLPPGRYSVVAWGNRDGRCPVRDPQLGVTSRDELLIMIDNPDVNTPGYHDNGDRLYYGYRTFSVEHRRISRIRVDVTHAHLSLTITVRWDSSRNAPSAGDGPIQFRLTELPSEYAFMPEYISRERVCRGHDPAADDDYLVESQETLHYIPRNFTDLNIVSHRCNSNITVDRRVDGELVTFRLRNGSRAAVNLHQLTSGGAATLMREVPLGDYFAQMGEDLDRSLRQEYALEFVIGDEGSVTVLPVGIADWDEGGSLGYD